MVKTKGIWLNPALIEQGYFNYQELKTYGFDAVMLPDDFVRDRYWGQQREEVKRAGLDLMATIIPKHRNLEMMRTIDAKWYYMDEPIEYGNYTYEELETVASYASQVGKKFVVGGLRNFRDRILPFCDVMYTSYAEIRKVFGHWVYNPFGSQANVWKELNDKYGSRHNAVWIKGYGNVEFSSMLGAIQRAKALGIENFWLYCGQGDLKENFYAMALFINAIRKVENV